LQAHSDGNTHMKRANILLLLLSSMFALILVEVGYRIVLADRIDKEDTFKPDPAPTFSFWAYPAPWRYDEKLGFAYNNGTWLAGNIEKGLFANCGYSGLGNSYGNAYALRSDYSKADIKIFLMGSSFTMTMTKNGLTVSDVLEKRLSQLTGKSVSILNFSRDSTGILNAFDIAQAGIDKLKPDLMLFVFNTTQFGYQRHWRVVHPDPRYPGIWRMAFSLDPSDKLADPRRVILQQQVISNEVTSEWCDRLSKAVIAKDESTLRNDPVVKKLIAAREQIRHDVTGRLLAVDFYATNVSFAYNRIKHKNPYYRMKVFEENTVYAPLSTGDYGTDKVFVGAVGAVRKSGIPYFLIHIPAHKELGERLDGNYDFGGFGAPADREKQQAASIESVTSKKIFHLYDLYDPASKREPKSLVVSDVDSHPSPAGVEAMAIALERLLLQSEEGQKLLRPRP
jgi:hypothetical protein